MASTSPSPTLRSFLLSLLVPTLHLAHHPHSHITNSLSNKLSPQHISHRSLKSKAGTSWMPSIAPSVKRDGTALSAKTSAAASSCAATKAGNAQSVGKILWSGASSMASLSNDSLRTVRKAAIGVGRCSHASEGTLDLGLCTYSLTLEYLCRTLQCTL